MLLPSQILVETIYHYKFLCLYCKSANQIRFYLNYNFFQNNMKILLFFRFLDFRPFFDFQTSIKGTNYRAKDVLISHLKCKILCIDNLGSMFKFWYRDYIRRENNNEFNVDKCYFKSLLFARKKSITIFFNLFWSIISFLTLICMFFYFTMYQCIAYCIIFIKNINRNNIHLRKFRWCWM